VFEPAASLYDACSYRPRAAASLSENNVAPVVTGRAIMPQRYSLSSASASPSTSGGSILQQARQAQAPRYPSSSTPMVRSASVDRSLDRSGVTSAPSGSLASSLRASINTDTLSAAVRQRHVPGNLPPPRASLRQLGVAS
jgi:hypothetical protein